MPHLSLRVDEELLDELDAEAEERGVSRSDHIRNTLESRERVEELERENQQLRNQLAAVNAHQEDVDELVEYVEEERALQREERERRRERERAPIWRRVRWAIFGRE